LAGLLFGLTAVLKPEIMLSAGIVTGAALLLNRIQSKALPVSNAVAWVAAAALPTIAFCAYFSAHVPFRDALVFAGRAWINVVATTRFTSEFIQASFLGFDHPRANLLSHATAALAGALLIGGFAAFAVFMDRVARQSVRVLAGCILLGALAWIALDRIDWFVSGRCLLGLALAYLLCNLVSIARHPGTGRDAARSALRWMIGVLAAAMMSRMLLNARIIQFGFYQAALAGILVPAVLIGELPDRIGLGRWGRTTLAVLTVTLVGIGTTRIAVESQKNLHKRAYQVGEGIDQFYSYPPPDRCPRPNREYRERRAARNAGQPNPGGPARGGDDKLPRPTAEPGGPVLLLLCNHSQRLRAGHSKRASEASAGLDCDHQPQPA